ncbi:hypothetical protein [Nitrosomonas sp.]|uniref:hypothetical protein n=1 Tax=Nitrosomonas sp. TaxID=42353 RepID=UPI0025F227DB|nr:hypothetical protein [Nitrosomonas sp.]
MLVIHNIVHENCGKVWINNAQGELAVVLLLFLAISAFIFLKADSPDTETTVYYLAVAVILWAVLCFLYVFIRDAVIALR